MAEGQPRPQPRRRHGEVQADNAAGPDGAARRRTAACTASGSGSSSGVRLARSRPAPRPGGPPAARDARRSARRRSPARPPRSARRSRRSGAADRMRASAPPDGRSATATASHSMPRNADRDRGGPSARRPCGIPPSRAAGPAPTGRGRPARRPCRPRPRRAPPVAVGRRGRAGRPPRASGPRPSRSRPRRKASHRAGRSSSRPVTVLSDSRATISRARSAAHQFGAVEHGAGQPRVRADRGHLPAPRGDPAARRRRRRAAAAR